MRKRVRSVDIVIPADSARSCVDLMCKKMPIDFKIEVLKYLAEEIGVAVGELPMDDLESAISR